MSIVPVLPGAKHPVVRWKLFQEQRPTPEQVQKWVLRWPNSGWTVILGPVSGLLAIDVDGEEAHKVLLAKLGSEPITPKVFSGSRDPFRYHLYFRYPTGVATKSKITPWNCKLEFRGNRGLTVLPPSIHKSGNPYAFAPGRSFAQVLLCDVPAPIMEALQEANAHKRTMKSQATAPTATSGSQHVADAIIERARAYLSKLPPAVQGNGGDKATYTAACRLVIDFALTPEAALPLLLEFNERCVPPWPEDELVRKLAAADSSTGPRGMLSASKPPSFSISPATPMPPSATVPASITLARVRDVGMIDGGSARLFEVLRRCRGVFNDTKGYRHVPVFSPSDSTVEYAAHCRERIKSRPALWTDDNGRQWLFRRAFSSTNTPEIVCGGLAIHLPDVQASLPASVAAIADNGDRVKEAIRRLSLHHGAAAILWYLHAQILIGQTSRVRTTDRELGELLFGHRIKWPRNWRRDLAIVLSSLGMLHRGILYVTADCRLAMESSPLLHRIEEKGNLCHKGCALSGTAGLHRHYSIEVGEAFLGSLSKFDVETDETGEKRFDFNPDRRKAIELAEQDIKVHHSSNQGFDQNQPQRNKELNRKLRAARKEAMKRHSDRFRGILSVAFMPQVFGHQLGLTGIELVLLNRIVREITRGTKSQTVDRDDRARVFRGNSVPGSRRKTSMMLSALSPDGEYVECNGNGTNQGTGYRIATLIDRSFGAAIDDKPLKLRTKRYLTLIRRIQYRLGLIAVGVHKDQVFTLAQLQSTAASKCPEDLAWLQQTCLRFYLPADYLNRWRATAATKIVSPGAKSQTRPDLVRLRERIKSAGFTQTKLAARLGKNRTYISKVLCGRKPCSQELLARIENLV